MRKVAAVVSLCALSACSRTVAPVPVVETEAGAPAPTPAPALTPAREEIRYLALGDSFTIGTGNAPSEAFPSRLAERWRARDRNVTLKNVAVNGYTTEDVAVREIPEVAPFRPTFVTLAVGANDRVRGLTAEAYRKQLRSVIKAIVDAGVPAKSLVTLPQPEWSASPQAAAFGDPVKLAADIVAFNVVIREETESVGGRYVDLYPLMHKQAEAKMFAGDGLHPSAAAHHEWAAALADQLPLPPLHPPPPP